MSNKKIGAYLKSLREEKELTLEDVSKATKIKIRFLDDIEKNKFDDLGGVGYAKAMIHSYGKFLKTDLKFLLELLNNYFSDTVLPDLEEKPVTGKKILFSTTLIPVVAIVIFAIIFGFVVIKNYNAKKNISPLSNQKVVETKIKEEYKESKDEVIDSNVLQDTTNYLDKYMFKKKSSPFKSDQ